MLTDAVGEPERTVIPIRCDVPATIMSIGTPVSSLIHEGDEIALLESMKMEIPVLSPVSGVLVALNVVVGETVPGNHILALVAPLRRRRTEARR